MMKCNNNRSNVELTSTQTPSSLVPGIALVPDKQQLRLSSVQEFENCKAIQIQQGNHCLGQPKSILFWGKLKQDTGLHAKSIQSGFHTALLYCPWVLGYATVFLAGSCRCSVSLALGEPQIYQSRSAYRESKEVPRETWIAWGLEEQKQVCSMVYDAKQYILGIKRIWQKHDIVIWGQQKKRMVDMYYSCYSEPARHTHGIQKDKHFCGHKIKLILQVLISRGKGFLFEGTDFTCIFSYICIFIKVDFTARGAMKETGNRNACLTRQY